MKSLSPITRGHRTTPSQESNTLSVVSCMTDLSVDSGHVNTRLSDLADDFASNCEDREDIGRHARITKTVSSCSTDGLTKDYHSETSDYASDHDDLERRDTPEIDLAPDPFNEKNNSVTIQMPEDKEVNLYPSEPLKTGLSALFLLLGWLATTASLALTHERVPNTKPLPDIILDNVPHQEWALDASEILIMISTISAVIVVMCHTHRLIILRRIWYLLGLLYFYRSLTMFITVLPKADTAYTCKPKMNDTTAIDIARRVLTIISGGGLSINGKHVYCGDYIFSGHTLVLTMGYLAIKQYSPRRYFPLHWLSLCISLTGVILLLLARGHYSIDVIVAYWITTRLWWLYHTMANNSQLKKEGQHNLLDSVWWWRIFLYFEGNVGAELPRQYSWPLVEWLGGIWRAAKCTTCRCKIPDWLSCCCCRRTGGSSQIE